MPFIRVTNLENSVSWEKGLNQNEFEQVENLIKKRASTVPFTASLLVPVRTNNFTYFAKDFFLPTTVNHALGENYSYFKSDSFIAKIANVVLKALSIISSLFLDFITLPIRLVTCIPRVYSNRTADKNVLHRYLIDQKVDEKLLSSGSVEVSLGRFGDRVQSIFWTDIVRMDLIETPSGASPSFDTLNRLNSLRQWSFNKKWGCGVFVKNPNNQAIWSKMVDQADYKLVKESLTKGEPTVNVFKAALYPVRTNLLKNFAIDLFLPTTLNVAVRVERAAHRVFAIIGAILFDLLTLPIRLVTAIPRIIANSNPKITPLHQFLLDKKVDAEILEADYLHVELENFEYKGDKLHREKIHNWEEKYVNLIETPMHEGWDIINSKMNKSQEGQEIVL